MQPRELVWKVQGFGDKPKGRRSSNLLAKFGDKIIKKAKGWKGSLQERFSVVGRRDGVGGGREGGVWNVSSGGGAWGRV